MLLIVTALRKEADLFISSLHLTRDMQSGAFPVFVGDSIALIISGTGKLRAAIAATHLLSRPEIAVEETFLCNFGFCGSMDQALPPGSLVTVPKVSDADTGRDYYPDYPLSMPDSIARACTLCVTRPMGSEGISIFEKHPDAQICDMESAGIMESAGRFLSTRRVLILKIVSDMLNPVIPDLSVLDRYLLNNAATVLDILRAADLSTADSMETSDTRLFRLIEPLSIRLRLTARMEKQLVETARLAILGGAAVEDLLDASEFIEPADKRERKKDFEQILRRLRDAAISDNLH